jgi:hypothetical protein
MVRRVALCSVPRYGDARRNFKKKKRKVELLDGRTDGRTDGRIDSRNNGYEKFHTIDS